jgi:hypothetical protein
MAFWDEVASMDNLLIGSVGGQSVTFASATGSPSFTISGIVERNDVNRVDGLDDGDHFDASAVVSVRRSAFVAGMTRLPTAGDTMTIDGTVFKVYDVTRDLSMLMITGQTVARINRFADGADQR